MRFLRGLALSAAVAGLAACPAPSTETGAAPTASSTVAPAPPPPPPPPPKFRGPYPPGLERKWVDGDMAVFDWLRTRVGGGALRSDALTKDLPDNGILARHDLGFGAERVVVTLPGGYGKCIVRALALDGVVKGWRAACSMGAKRAPVLAKLYRDRLDGVLPVADETRGKRLFYAKREEKLKAGVAAVQARLAARLGARSGASVPAELAAAYDKLTSPWTSLTVGTACYMGGTPPEGRPEVDALEKAGRDDLLRDVLRGANPEGRIFAAAALTKMGKLSADDQTVLAKLRALPAKLQSCSGCMVSREPAKTLLAPLPGGDPSARP